jgi:hypothetical protein
VNDVTLLGVRHHGPGSARALVRALDELKPELILVEGPPEANDLVHLATSPEMAPPVALLAYPAKDAGSGGASFWPFAVFSPEWQALVWAHDRNVPLRFFDLPAAHLFALRAQPDGPDRLHSDPLGMLAEAAGYDDAERWWEDVIEHRRDGAPAFEAIGEAMAEVRAHVTANRDTADEAGPGVDSEADATLARRDIDEIREAYMRTAIRAARKEGFVSIAVVCGAWHVPALTDPLPPASADAKTLKGLPKTPVAMTWAPWTHGRLASWQGYGAGVSSPGWYHHLFTAPDRVVERWLVDVAAVLRDADVPVSSAHVIEATRLAETLATLRGRPGPGLSEVVEATRAVMCDGDEVRLALVNDRMVVGDRLGTVPSETPSAPLVRDLSALQRRLKLLPEALSRQIDLDLRKPVDIERSRLLHRLRLLGVDWGRPADVSRRGKGTFWESWQLEWAPELAVDLVAAGAYGVTVEGAAIAKVGESAAAASSLGDVTALVERCLLASLEDALGSVLEALGVRMALDVDVAHLMESLPALARSRRYGDVRGTSTASLGEVLDGLVTRICVGLPPALVGIDDDAAAQMRARIDAVHGALALLADTPGLRSRWIDAVAAIADRDDLHPLVAGRLCRLLRDEKRLDQPEVALRLGRALTIGTPPAAAAAWVEGFLSGGGLLLVHDAQLLALVDSWLAAIPAETFTDVLPLLRRTFATFDSPERRTIGERARTITHASGRVDADEAGDFEGYDVERALRVADVVRLIIDGPAVADNVNRRAGNTEGGEA